MEKFLCHQRGIFGLQTLDGGELLNALVIEKLLCRLVECDLTFMLRKKLLGVTGLAVGNIGITGLGVIEDMSSHHGDLRHARFCGFDFCRKFIEPGGSCRRFF